jgi:hypothetical protein
MIPVEFPWQRVLGAQAERRHSGAGRVRIAWPAEDHGSVARATRAWFITATPSPPASIAAVPAIRRWTNEPDTERAVQFPASGQAFRAVAVSEETVVADALKRVRENMQQEAPQELIGRQGHHFLLVLVLIGTGLIQPDAFASIVYNTLS